MILVEPVARPKKAPTLGANLTRLTASIGMTFYPLDDLEGDELLKNANAAMYSAQQKGGNNYQFHKSETIIVSREQLALETNLRLALKRS